jgi:cytochrome P450
MEDTAIDGVELVCGSRILVLYASANRDERKWDELEKFDVRRDARDHLGFGFGAHICAGMHLARLEMTALMKAFARRVSRFEPGEPVRAINNVLRGFESLPITVRRLRPCANDRRAKRPFIRKRHPVTDKE